MYILHSEKFPDPKWTYLKCPTEHVNNIISDDEIIEVPAPPKPPPTVVTLEENDDSNQEPFKPDPMESCIRLQEEEEDLYQQVHFSISRFFKVIFMLFFFNFQLKDIEEQRESIMDRLKHLSELRSEILTKLKVSFLDL